MFQCWTGIFSLGERNERGKGIEDIVVTYARGWGEGKKMKIAMQKIHEEQKKRRDRERMMSRFAKEGNSLMRTQRRKENK